MIKSMIMITNPFMLSSVECNGEIKSFWSHHWRTIIYAPYIMRLLNAFRVPSYILILKKSSLKKAVYSFFVDASSSMTTPNNLPWTMDYNNKSIIVLLSLLLLSKLTHLILYNNLHLLVMLPNIIRILKYKKLALNPWKTNLRDLALKNQKLITANQWSMNKKMTGLERSFSIRMTKMEKTLDRVVSTLEKVMQKVRGRSSSRSSTLPSLTPPPQAHTPVYHS